MNAATRLIHAAGLAGLTMILATACGSGSGIFGEIHTISVEVTGTGRAGEVKYQLLSEGDTERDVALPWKKDARGEFVPTSVTATGAGGAPVTCRIVLDGKEVASATSTATAPATCSKKEVDK